MGEQDRLQVKLANFKLTGGDFSIVQIEKHCVDLFSVWKKVADRLGPRLGGGGSRILTFFALYRPCMHASDVLKRSPARPNSGRASHIHGPWEMT